MDNEKTIREIGDALGVSRRAIQGYEKAGLVSATGKNKYGHLLYDEGAQNRIRRIKLYQQLGFRIKEIKGLMDAPAETIRKELESKIRHLKEEQSDIEELIQKARELLDNI